MTTLVADVGGTNARLARAGERGLDSATIRHYSNADYNSFDDVIAAYLAGERIDGIKTCCVAMAGPVAAERGSLTNRGWEISIDSLKAATASDRAILLNDLTALGYAIGHLPEEGVSHICGTIDPAMANGQSLVIGIGTGFNSCPVIASSGGITCLEAEAGHASLSLSVFSELERLIGADAKTFPTVEDCFSGRGLSRLFQLASGRAGLSASDVVAADRDGDDAEAANFLKLYAGMLGHLCRDLVLQYLPRDGVYFAGSVARGVLGSEFTAEFVAAFRRFGKFQNELSTVPIHLIEDDCAALIGCIEAAESVRL